MTDDLHDRRRRREEAKVRRTKAGTTLPSSRDDLPGWVAGFFIPSTACEACSRHWHHRCWGANVLLDPIPDCPCDCGDPRDQARLNPRAWADLAIHCPEEVWVAAMFERQRAAGIFACTIREDGTAAPAFRERRWR
jgi:hypothetical protein